MEKNCAAVTCVNTSVQWRQGEHENKAAVGFSFVRQLEAVRSCLICMCVSQEVAHMGRDPICLTVMVRMLWSCFGKKILS